MTGPEKEVRAAYARMVDTRNRAEKGELAWGDLADFFSEDAVFVDPGWGRIHGRDAIRQFMQESMQGLDGWSFPHQWTMAEGIRVVTAWMNRLPGRRADGSHYEVPGLSVLEYAGDGLFASEYDHLNMVHVHEVLKESGWKPSGPIIMPPKTVQR